MAETASTASSDPSPVGALESDLGEDAFVVAAMTAPNDSVEFGAELEPAYAIPVVIVVAVDLPGMVSSSVAVAAAPVSHATFQQTGMLASSRLDLGHRRRPRASCCAAADRAPDKVHSYRPDTAPSS